MVQAVVNTITQTLATTIKDTSQVGMSLTDAIADVGHAAKGIMLGVLRSSKAEDPEGVRTIRHTAHVAIRSASAALLISRFRLRLKGKRSYKR